MTTPNPGPDPVTMPMFPPVPDDGPDDVPPFPDMLTTQDPEAPDQGPEPKADL
jgi:hypothetical protein